MKVNIDETIIADVVAAIDEKIAHLQATRTELLQGMKAPDRQSPDGGAPKRRKQKADPPPTPKRSNKVRYFVSQADIVTVLNEGAEPMTEMAIKAALADLLNVKPGEGELRRVLGAQKFRKGSKGYRKNKDGKYELYDPEEEE